MAASWPARSWSPGELVTAANMNLTRDQLNELHSGTIGAGPGNVATVSGDLSVTGKLSVGGVATVLGIGQHVFGSINTGGLNDLVIKNTGTGAGTAARLVLQNDVNAAHSVLQSVASTYPVLGVVLADSTSLWGQGAGGVSIVANAATGAVRLCTNNGERLKVWPSGGVSVNASAVDPGLGNLYATGSLQLSTSGSQTNVRALNIWGSDPTSGVVATLYSGTSGRVTALQFSDGFTYNVACGGDASGNFLVWAGKFPGTAGTALFAVTPAGNMQVNGSGNISGNLTVVGTTTFTGAVNLTTGTGNVAMKTIDNNMVAQTLGASSRISGANGALYFYDSSGPVNQRTWRVLQYSNGNLIFELLNDAISAIVASPLRLNAVGGLGTTSIDTGGSPISCGPLTCGTITSGVLNATAGNINGILNVGGYLATYGYIYPGRADAPGNVQTAYFLASHNSYGLYSNTGLYLVGRLLANNGAYFAGDVFFNTNASPYFTQFAFATDAAVRYGVSIQNTNATVAAYMLVLANNANTVIGSITQIAGMTSVTFNSASDARLKTDLGRSTDLTALRRLVIHDFAWKADEGVRGRGVFAQEAYALIPEAITPGKDDLTPEGALVLPWMADYSKLVPHLIVGWQQHEAEIAALKAALATLKGDTHV